MILLSPTSLLDWSFCFLKQTSFWKLVTSVLSIFHTIIPLKPNTKALVQLALGFYKSFQDLEYSTTMHWYIFYIKIILICNFSLPKSQWIFQWISYSHHATLLALHLQDLLPLSWLFLVDCFYYKIFVALINCLRYRIFVTSVGCLYYRTFIVSVGWFCYIYFF